MSKGITLILLLALAFSAGCAKKATVNSGAIAPSAETEAVDSRAIPQPTEIGEGYGADISARSPQMGELQTIYFDFDSFTLETSARQTLESNARWLQANPESRIVIEGHTDERGSDVYNLALGERRARSAMNYLHALGVAAERISTISYGEEKPAVDGQDESAWAKNRRAEFR